MAQIQIRITIEKRGEGDRNPTYIIEAQSIHGEKFRSESAYADHADVVLHTLVLGARLAGVPVSQVATFFPEHWDEIVAGAKLDAH